jgi:hypothetical protein
MTAFRSRKKFQITLSDSARARLVVLVERTGWPASRLIESWILGAQLPPQQRSKEGG